MRKNLPILNIALPVVLLFCLVSLPGGSHALTMRSGVPDDAEIVGGGNISTGHEFAVTFMPDQKTAFFTRNFPDKKVNHIMRAEIKKGVWQTPLPVSFSSDQWSDLDPSVSPNGKRLFFVSTRPASSKQDQSSKNMDIWYSDRKGNEWLPPVHLDKVNSADKEGSPSVSKDGVLCFFSDRGRPANSNSIYCAEPDGDGYAAPVKLGREVNSEASDTSPFLTPDGNVLFFYSTRAGGFGQADLYASFRHNGKWSTPYNLGPKVNTADSEYNPVLSPDYKTLYFGRNGNFFSISVTELDIKDLLPQKDKSWI